MAALSRFFPLLFLLVCGAERAVAASAPTCETMQARIKTLTTAIQKATGKDALRMRTELDRLSTQQAARCAPRPVRKFETPGAANVLSPVLPGQPEEFAEDEIRRRREAINRQGRQAGEKSGGAKSGRGRPAVSGTRAIPVEGFMLLEGGSSSTFLGKARQEITYAIQETFVGNLFVTRAGGREDYALQTLSTEIDVDRFSGRGCAQYTGSPPVCSRWHRLDLWQIADGEEYPGKADGVVSLTSDGRAVTVRIDPPVIDFGSSEGPVSVRTGCGQSFRETLSRDEFKQWLGRSTVRIKREVGKTTPGCRPGSTLTLEMHLGPAS